METDEADCGTGRKAEITEPAEERFLHELTVNSNFELHQFIPVPVSGGLKQA